MQNDLWIKEVMENLAEDGSNIALECIDAMFQKSCIKREPWSVTEHLEGTFDYIFSLISRNSKFKSNLCIGIQIESIATFIGYEIDIEEAKDAFGEFGNVYCAMLMDNPLFKDKFGILRQALPEDAINEAFFPKAWGLNGRLYLKDHWIYMGYSMQEEKAELDFL